MFLRICFSVICAIDNRAALAYNKRVNSVCLRIAFE